MESGSQASDPPGRTSQRFANLVGTLIALITLTVPIFAIAHFSSASYEPLLQSPTQLLPRSGGLDD